MSDPYNLDLGPASPDIDAGKKPPRPTISEARVRYCANIIDQLFRQRHTFRDVEYELRYLLKDAGVEVKP